MAILLDELQNLRLLPVVASEGSFAGAARRQNCAASVVMRSITSLEGVLNQSLLERHSAGVRLTAAGKLVNDRALRIEAEITAAATVFVTDSRSSLSLHSLKHHLGSGQRLRLISELVARGSARAAAETLAMSQPGISMALGRMEKSLGRQLFDRARRGLVPTGDCQKLLTHITRIQAEIRALGNEIESLAGDISGTVVLGLLAVGRLHIVPSAVIRSRKAYPNLRVRTLALPYDRMLAALSDGRLDLVVGVSGSVPDNAGFRTLVLGGNELGIFVRAGHPLLDLQDLTLADLKSEEWILPRAGTLSRKLVTSAFEHDTCDEPQAAVETSDSEFIRQLVLGSDMIAIAPPEQFVFDIETKAIARLPIRLACTARQTALIEREEALPSPAVAVIRNAICEQAELWSAETPPALSPV